MAKRFTSTDKWQDPWFCGLSMPEKLFWIYLLDNCDMAGIWQVNWPLVKFFIPEFDFKKDSFKNRILEISPHKWHIPKFIQFQYGELKNNNRLHSSVLMRLEKEGVFIPLVSPSQGAKDKDKDKDKDKVKDKVKPFSNVDAKPPNDLQRVVLAYKLISGYEKEDAAWDKLNFGRCAKSAKMLLEFLGSWEEAANCIQDVYEKLSSKGLTVTLETVAKHAADWKKDKQEVSHRGILHLQSCGNRTAV